MGTVQYSWRRQVFSDRMRQMLHLQEKIERFTWIETHESSARDQAAAKALRREAQADLDKLYEEHQKEGTAGSREDSEQVPSHSSMVSLAKGGEK